MADMKNRELHVIPTSPQPVGALPEPHVERKVLASVRSAKVELDRLRQNHAQDGLGIRRMEDYITGLQGKDRAKADSALGSSHGSNSGSGDSGSSERRRLIEKNSETPFQSQHQSIINQPIGLEAAVQASQIKIRNLEQAATDATKERKSAATLLCSEQTATDHLTHYHQLLKEQVLNRKQILDRLENTELEHERIDSDTNNETIKHDRRKKDMEHRRIVWRAEREQQELKQHTLESQLNRQQKLEPKRNTKQIDTKTRTEVKELMTARELRETLEQERRQRQTYRPTPQPNTASEKDAFCRHLPSVDAAYDENLSCVHQLVQEEDIKPKKDPPHRQTYASAVAIENDNSLYAVSDPGNTISKPAAAPSEQNIAAHATETPCPRRPNIDNNIKYTSFTEESTIRPCQPPADALASVIHGLQAELAVSKQTLSELVKLYNDHNADRRKRVRKSLALRIESVLAEVERTSDYLYSLHDVVGNEW